MTDAETPTVGVACGRCGGQVYFATCGQDGCEYAVLSECVHCGPIEVIRCPVHGLLGDV